MRHYILKLIYAQSFSYFVYTHTFTVQGVNSTFTLAGPYGIDLKYLH